MRRAIAAALLISIAWGVNASVAQVNAPKDWTYTRQTHQIGAILDTSSTANNTALKGTWEVTRRLGSVAGDPALPFYCGLRHYDTTAKDKGVVRFTILVNGKKVHAGKSAIGADQAQQALTTSKALDLSKHGPDATVTCRAKVSSPMKFKQGTTAILSLSASGTVNAFEARESGRFAAAPAFSGPRYRTPKGWMQRSPRLRDATTNVAAHSKKSAKIKGKWMATQRLGELAGGAFSQLICTLGINAVLDKPVKGKAIGAIKIDGKQVYRDSVTMDSYTSVIANSVDLSKYTADSVIECTITAKGKVNVPEGRTVSNNFSATARVD